MKERDPVLAGVFPHSVAKSVTRGHDGVKAASQCATRHVYYQEVNECYAKFDEAPFTAQRLLRPTSASNACARQDVARFLSDVSPCTIETLRMHGIPRERPALPTTSVSRLELLRLLDGGKFEPVPSPGVKARKQHQIKRVTNYLVPSLESD